MTTYVPPPEQKWCGQTQPHGPHVWVTTYNMYASCGGHA